MTHIRQHHGVHPRPTSPIAITSSPQQETHRTRYARHSSVPDVAPRPLQVDHQIPRPVRANLRHVAYLVAIVTDHFCSRPTLREHFTPRPVYNYIWNYHQTSSSAFTYRRSLGILALVNTSQESTGEGKEEGIGRPPGVLGQWDIPCSVISFFVIIISYRPCGRLRLRLPPHWLEAF